MPLRIMTMTQTQRESQSRYNGLHGLAPLPLCPYPPTSLQPAFLSNSLEAPCALPQTSQADSNLRAFALAIPADSQSHGSFPPL